MAVVAARQLRSPALRRRIPLRRHRTRLAANSLMPLGFQPLPARIIGKQGPTRKPLITLKKEQLSRLMFRKALRILNLCAQIRRTRRVG